MNRWTDRITGSERWSGATSYLLLAGVLAILLLIELASVAYVERSSDAAESLLREDFDQAVSATSLAQSVRQVHGRVYRALTLRAAAGSGTAYSEELERAKAELDRVFSKIEQLRSDRSSPEFGMILGSSATALEEYSEALRWLRNMMEVDFDAAVGFIEPFDAVFDNLARRLEQVEVESRLVAQRRVSTLSDAATWTMTATTTGIGLAALLLAAASWITGWRRARTRLHTAALQRMVEQRTAELRAMSVKAEAASSAKTEFLASLGHELRTPLHAMMGILQLLKRMQGRDAQHRYLAAAEEVGGSFMQLLDSLLDLASVEAGVLSVQESTFDVTGLVGRVVDLFRPVLAERGLRVDFTTEPIGPRWVVGDPNRLRQVVVNLVSNAAKFTEQGHVLVRVECSGSGDILIAVEDSGPGIPQHLLPTLFQRFRRTVPGPARRTEGHGLGLYLSARLVEAMGGAIWAESAEGVGSTFRVRLRLPPTTEPARHPGVGAACRILVIEDVPLSAEILSTILADDGHAVTVAHSAAEARAACWRSDFDVAVTDLELPDADGVALIGELTGCYPRMRLLAVSAAYAARGPAAIAAGAADFLSKPIDFDKLRRLINSSVHGETSLDDPGEAGPAGGEQGGVNLPHAERWQAMVGPAFFRKKLSQFGTMAGGFLEEIKVAAARNDADAVARAAHRAAGHVSTFGCTAALSILSAIEADAREGRLAGIDERLAALGLVLRQAISTLVRIFGGDAQLPDLSGPSGD
ncbi:MAG TPA: ATP-binding protein [Azospirillaceae bacterium]|nr:ATP-binding protein [Azospirillaceae bacterium]